MKFHFLGGMDCPDWLLSQICSNFAKFTSLKFRSLCQQAVNYSLEGGQFDEKQLEKCITEEIYLSDLYNTVSILSIWLFEKPAGYLCSADDLQKELVQLGLPPENAKVLHKIYNASQERLREKLKNSVFSEPHAEIISKSQNSLELLIADQTLNLELKPSLLKNLENDLKLCYEKLCDM
ncbi:unnamed protein product [Caenorhabditis angaria]|uniref:COMM domain-containing protein n=1 Tax=Caenorhabditis angaria TaxID=860376 RepID=A0A9P1I5M5_9PELO|nr:unnamed protein product [Caenorhabditis angaria]